jgi:3alpha(or 20beta)-hydroxysteroid dehydrogenase
MGRLDGKTALISGAARGMGLATAQLFVAEGARVVMADVLDDAGKAAADELGEAAQYVHLDVVSESDWTDAVAAAERWTGALHILHNNAGIVRWGSITEMSVEDYQTLVNVNQIGVFCGMKCAVPAMRRAGGGSIINVSSVEGMHGAVGLVGYTATKFAVRGMTKTAAVELGPDKIRVNAICPGAIDTPMIRFEGLEHVDYDKVFKRIPAGRAGRATDVALMTLFLASDESSYITGQDFVVDGGATAYIGWSGPLGKMG